MVATALQAIGAALFVVGAFSVSIAAGTAAVGVVAFVVGVALEVR